MSLPTRGVRGLRILLANTSGRERGGIETYLYSLIPLLQAAGHDVGFVTAGSPPGNDNPLPGDIPSWFQENRPPQELMDDLVRWAPEVVFTQASTAELDAKLTESFPTVYFNHNYGGTCVSGTKCHTFPAVQPCNRRMGLACLAYYLPRRCGGLNLLTAIGLYNRERGQRAVFSRCRAVLVASRHMAAEVIRNGVAAELVHHVPLFPTGSSPDPAPPELRPFTGRVLYVGRITALKGWNQLLDAIPAASSQLGRELTLVVAGDGPDRQKFEGEAVRRGVPVEFLGWVDSARRQAEMRNADLLVVPSVWPEPFGLVGIEGGCVGLPSAAFAVGGIPDWLLQGVSGELAPGEYPGARGLADAIIRALRSSEHWQRLRVGAWEVSRRFTPEAHLEALVPILRAACGSPLPGPG